eukprot:CAMPEP_0179015166 /NCGR_PEP_ID=MMETSP0796-20121207/2648_1 /TAXON_ID=73915 /ORGANISM="Pyrodinium bahamense, Strain pbaha01" /LENGTH=127 /DNA_ID=CAMNT_0020710785 /DNA_START=779 /DNA_END=1158 /DNA_ORIENTATION=+
MAALLVEMVNVAASNPNAQMPRAKVGTCQDAFQGISGVRGSKDAAGGVPRVLEVTFAWPPEVVGTPSGTLASTSSKPVETTKEAFTNTLSPLALGHLKRSKNTRRQQTRHCKLLPQSAPGLASPGSA